MAALVLVAPALAIAGRPAIPPGREAAIAGLVAPYRLGEPITPGWTLHSIGAEVSTIHVWIAGPDGGFAHLTLDHPDYAPADATPSAAFALARAEAPAGSEAAIVALEAAIIAADDGSFWRAQAPLTVDAEVTRGRFASGPAAWLGDGLVLFAGFTALLLWLVRRALRGAPRGIAGGLALVTLIGAGLRLALAPVAGLTAWPYTRVPWPAARIFEGPLLALLHPGPAWLSDVITTTTLAFAILAPLAVFVHARHLLADGRAALVAAALLALLPQHIRFSESDVVFIASITISSLTFALVHAAAREPGRWALAALVLLAPALALTYAVRPLNILYGPLMLAALLVDQGLVVDKPAASRRRRLAVGGVLAALTLGVGIPGLVAEYPSQLRGGLALATLGDGLRLLVDPRDNALLNPSMTPPLLPLLALFGGWELWRRGRRRLLAFLVGWLLAFLFGHAYVIPREPLMQARYHLHLVVPFLYLVTCGLTGLAARLRGRWRAPLLALVGLGLAASPLVYRGFIGDLDLNETDEWRWVHGLREAVPEGCTVVEWTDPGGDARFARVGAHALGQAPASRWTSVAAPIPADGEPLPPAVEAVLAAPPACLYVYEGLPCFAFKRPRAAIAGACEALRGRLALDEVARLERRSRPYDEGLSAGLATGEPFTLRLTRARR